jgi:putative tricarboxylic transport membrane protein
LRIDYIIIGASLTACAAYLYGTTQIPGVSIGDPVGPRAYPYLLGFSLLIATGLLFLETRRATSAADGDVNVIPENQRGRSHAVLPALVIWTLLYFAVFERLGFVLASSSYLFGLFWFLNKRSPVLSLVVAVAFCLGTYFVFSRVLGVNLGRGLLPL